MRSLVIGVVLAASVPAFAQAPGQVAPVAAPAGPAPTADAKAPGTALGLSLGATLAGAVLFTAGVASHDGALAAAGGLGLYVGPLAGHWYAHRFDGLGLAFRALSSFGMLTAFVVLANSHAECFDQADPQCQQDIDAANRGATIGYTVAVASIGAWLASSIYDIATAPRAARQWNDAHHVQLAPTAIRSAGRYVPAIALGMRF